MRTTGTLVISLLGVVSVGCQQRSPEQAPFFFVDHADEADTEYDRTDFPSFPEDASFVAPVTLKEETRESITPPLNSRLSFMVRVPRKAVLRYAIAVKTLDESNIWPPIEFRLSITEGGETETVFVESVNRERPDRWLDRETDLNRWSGQTVRLTFETKLRRSRDRIPPTASRILPSWGNPVLLSADRYGERPDLILISVDCLRADHVGAYGYARDTTPNIDRLAADGVVFETAVSNSSWTIPGHMSMFTGLLPSVHGATKREKLDGSIAYLSELLAAGGYHTGGVASWIYVSQLFGFERGFHTYRVLGDENTRAGDGVDAALESVGRAKGRSQFLFLHLFDPHTPYLPPREYLETFGPRPRDISDLHDKIIRLNKPASDVETEEIKRLYDAEIAYTDRELGRFFDGLKTMGIYDRALILLTADHGEAFYEHGHWQHTESLYDEILGVPLIVKWPEPSPRGRVRSQVSSVDIFATLLEAAGVEPPTTDSTNLMRFVDGAEENPESSPAISEVTWRSPDTEIMKISFRTEELKYIATLSAPAGEELGIGHLSEEELYDLLADPREQLNLLPGASRDVASYRDRLQAYLQLVSEHRRARDGQEVELDEATKERLRSLGYVVH
jgi:arylsulfatase A-like enzyme